MTITNPFKYQAIDLSGFARDAQMITPNDSVEFSIVPIAIRVATAGDLHVITERGYERTLVVMDNEVLSLGIKKVFATGTTATGLLAYYV